ncbi:RNA polymerase sigma-70 factor, ECF subfamily [Chitinophaga terrae (ex Kim and Jung 2007)]|uniref:RNA polymerase sigma-70 factor, ECF subfamily n=1 Tax=Chitinophaga terrae (ex Kim and Jung 2007) TaxID=408074 RepID=A0A1H4DPZ0_9BACT|nr:sigma-70 family RNA polymerase sigma factor [Chitinophaga terrae (ex Kim and Jung 2007)]MDQ0107880.1 RNA polymerase sigma-70 factor (ECF subfamily) [Chitinophaga terrae (ex Kim and Jung 2007)]GEP91050.1 RNA polymerase sigma-70 factor [Chitinophaga terrae (ex Kim and Jung 2007)]SEA74578.1 RNA polymerase sigma-70 factor, ECF subfamily [Chitinophaga terrae (ex Kim and Jung 2007)]
MRNDRECWSLFKDGHTHAYREIYEQHYDKLYNYSFQVLQDYDDCKDLLQDFFTKLWMNRETLPIPDNPESFLVSLLKFRIIDVIRKKHVRRKHTDVYSSLLNEVDSDSPSQSVIFREELAKLHHLVAQLPEQLKLVFRLHYFEALSIDEISTQFSKSPQTVRNQLNTATTRLRAQLRNSYLLTML